MMNLPFVSTGEHCPQLLSKPFLGEVESGCRIVQIGLDRHRGGVIRSSELRDEDEVGLLSPWSLRDRKGDIA